MPTLPDLTGQPAWVVVVVVALFTAGTLGTAWLRRRDGGEPEPEDDATARPVESGAVPSLPSAPHDGATLAIQKALDHLAAEAAESREARAETAALRRELEAMREELAQRTRQRDAAQELLVRCEARAELLTQQAQDRRGEQHG